MRCRNDYSEGRSLVAHDNAALKFPVRPDQFPVWAVAGICPQVLDRGHRFEGKPRLQKENRKIPVSTGRSGNWVAAPANGSVM
jgi:hypothetical protein